MLGAIGRRVLILEDESQLATRIADHLEDAGYEVAGPVRNVLEAKRIIGVDGIDCAILNADLKDESPFCLAKEIAVQGAPVLLISNPAHLRLRKSDIHYRRLEKPFTREQLLSQVNALFAS